MSCVSDNYVVPGANPCGGDGGIGVESVGAGTPNVTITGTPENPLINVTNVGGVTQVEGQIGNINLNGVGITVVGGSPNPGDVTLTAAVQSITGSGGGIVVTQPTAGNYNLAVTANAVNNITQGAGITLTQPIAGTYNIASVVQNVTGTGSATVTQPTAGTYQVAVPAPPVTNITGSGLATVTQPTTGTFNVNVGSVDIGVASVNAVTGVMTVVGTGATTVSTNLDAKIVTVATQAVTSLSPGTNVDGVTLTSTDSSVVITNPTPGIINLAVTPGGVTSISPGTLTGAITLASADSSVAVTTPSAGIINLAVANSSTTRTFGFTITTVAGAARYYFVVNENLRMNDTNYTVVTSRNGAVPIPSTDIFNIQVTKNVEYVDFLAKKNGFTNANITFDVIVYTKNFTKLTPTPKTFTFPPWEVPNDYDIIPPGAIGSTIFVQTLSAFPPDYVQLYNATVNVRLAITGTITFSQDPSHSSDTNRIIPGVCVNSGSPTEVPIINTDSGVVTTVYWATFQDYTTFVVPATLSLNPATPLAYTFKIVNTAPGWVTDYIWYDTGMRLQFDYIAYL